MQNEERKPVTLRQVAERAGVSAATVSLVLNGKGDITQRTRAKVHAAVSELSYTPRTSRTKSDSTHTVRFLKIAKHGHTVNRDHNHFISDYIDGMSAEATRRDYSLEVVSHEGEDISAAYRAAEDRAVRGVIVLATELSESDIRSLSGGRTPVVFIDAYYPFLEANFVDMDNDQTIFLAVSELKRCGAERIDFVGSHSDVVNFRLRAEAFRRACDVLGLPPGDSQMLSVPATREGAVAEARRQFASGRSLADAYVCANDIVAFGIMRALQEMGVSIPGEVSVVGFDNLPMSSMFSPTLTTIDVPKGRIGALAVRFLDDLIVAKEPEPPAKVLVSGRLIIRESSGGK